MRNRGISLITGSLLAALAIPVLAEHSKNPEEVGGVAPVVGERTGQGPFPAFSELDVNRDGRLSRQEAAEVETLQRQFEAADINQDNSLDESEFSAFETIEGVMPGLNSIDGARTPAR